MTLNDETDPNEPTYLELTPDLVRAALRRRVAEGLVDPATLRHAIAVLRGLGGKAYPLPGLVTTEDDDRISFVGLRDDPRTDPGDKGVFSIVAQDLSPLCDAVVADLGLRRSYMPAGALVLVTALSKQRRHPEVHGSWEDSPDISQGPLFINCPSVCAEAAHFLEAALVQAEASPEQPASADEWVSSAALRDRYGLRPDRLRKAAKRGRLSSRLVNRARFYRMDEVRRLYPEDVVDDA